MTSKLRVGLDLDGVFYDFGAGVKKFAIDTGERTEEDCCEIEDWHFYRRWNYSDAEFVDLCNRGVDAGVIFSYGEPHPGSVEAANFLYWILSAYTDHETVVVTDRSFGSDGGKPSRKATVEWLDRYGLQYDEIYFTADKTQAKLTYMIDDKLENYDALDKAGVTVFLLNRPWNYVKDDNRRRIDSVEEYVNLILDTESIGELQRL